MGLISSLLPRWRTARPCQRARRPSRKVTLGEQLESRHLLHAAAITGQWSGVFTSAVGVSAPISGLGTNTVSFGTPFAPGDTQSVVSFTGAVLPTRVLLLHHAGHGGVELGAITYTNTNLTGPSLAGLNLGVTVTSNIGTTGLNVPLGVLLTGSNSAVGGDKVSLIGRPILRVNSHEALEVVGFATPNPHGGRPILRSSVTVPENATESFPLLAKVIVR